MGFLDFTLVYAADGQIGTPGSSAPFTSPAQFVANFYTFALMIAGVLAFAVIVYGGLRQVFGKQEGKEWIKAALLGLLLLAGAYIVLKTINPALVNLTNPEIKELPPQSQ